MIEPVKQLFRSVIVIATVALTLSGCIIEPADRTPSIYNDTGEDVVLHYSAELGGEPSLSHELEIRVGTVLNTTRSNSDDCFVGYLVVETVADGREIASFGPNDELCGPDIEIRLQPDGYTIEDRP